MLKTILEKNHVKNYGFCQFSDEKICFSTRQNDKIDKKSQSMIVMSFPYFSENITKGNITYYACVEDYHKVIGEKLKIIISELENQYPDENFLGFVDSSPIDEVGSAVEARLGVKGRNSLLITPEYGSYVFLATIITTIKLNTENSQPLKNDTCLNCGLCVKKCPTGAIVEDYKIDNEKCLSHITQKKGELTESEVESIREAGLVWGCDICQKICPMNKNKKETYMESFKTNIVKELSKENVDEIFKSRAFGFRGKKVLHRNLDIIKGEN